MEDGSTLANLPPWARALLEFARVAHLGLVDDDSAPRVLPVTFALRGATFVSAVDDQKPKDESGELARLGWLRARPRAALTVDFYDDDWRRLAWVQVLGDVAIEDVADAQDAVDALSAKYEPYATRPPVGPVLRLTPERYLWWRASAPAA